MPGDFIPDSQFSEDQAAPAPAEPQAPIQPHADFIPDEQFQSDEEKYGTTGQQLKTGAEGLAKGLLGPIATGAERAMGVKGEDIRGRAEENPVIHYGSEAAGFVLPALATAGASAEAKAAVSTLGELTQVGLLSRTGKAVASAIGAESGAAKMAAQLGTENALFQIGDQLSKEFQGNPDNIQTAIANVGLAGLIGAGAGGALGKVSDLWKAKLGPGAEGFAKDFQGRLNDHANGAIPTADAVTKELGQHYSDITKMADEVYGPEGLKAKDIARAMPEATPKAVEKIAGQTNAIIDNLDSALKGLEGDPHEPLLRKAIENYAGKMSENATPQGVFEATQELKQQMQEFGRVSKLAPPPIADRAFVNTAKSLGGILKDSLENPDVWGKAAKRQQAINEAFKEFLPSLKDFEKRFTTAIGDSREIDPSKINTFLNQLGKPSAEIKKEMLENFLKASEGYQKVIGETHANLGLESPLGPSGLTATKAVLGDLTPGMKAADFIHSQALNAAAEGASEAVGAGLGHLSGVPGGGYMGAYFGHYALKPLMKTIMPSLIKPVMGLRSSGAGLRAAFDAIGAVIKGDELMTSATEAIFNTGKEVIPQRLVATAKQIEKLDKKAEKMADNPIQALNSPNEMGHYLPDHSSALNQTTMAAVNYLNQQRPKPTRNGPLDDEIMPTKAQEAAYERTLKIAEQPLTTLQHVKNGTLQSKDLIDLQAMYPQFYKNAREKLYGAMMDHVSKNGNIPYQARMGMSLFLGEPLDSTLTPKSILSAQATFLTAAPGPQPGQAVKPKRSTAPLSKGSSLVETPSQARESSKRGI